MEYQILIRVKKRGRKPRVIAVVNDTFFDREYYDVNARALWCWGRDAMWRVQNREDLRFWNMVKEDSKDMRERWRNRVAAWWSGWKRFWNT